MLVCGELKVIENAQSFSFCEREMLGLSHTYTSDGTI